MARRVPRRPPEVAAAEHQREAFGGAERGRSSVPLPVSRDSKTLARLRSGAANRLETVRAYQDTFTLAGGAETVELTYLPLTFSEHVYMNGVYQREGESYDWTRDSGTRNVNVLTPMDARAGDILIVEYLYYAGLTATPTPPSTLPTGPKYWYKLDETSGTTAADSSGNGYDGSFSGTYTLGQSPVAPDGGTSIYCNGGGLVLSSDATTDQQAASVGAWVNLSGTTSTAARQGILYGGINANHTYAVWCGMEGANLRFGSRTFVSTANLYESSVPKSALLDGRDHLVVTVATGSQLRIYIDGQLKEQGAFTGNSIPNYAQTLAILGVVGRVDQLAGWSRALTEVEISEWWGS